MVSLLEEFAEEHPSAVIRRGGEIYVAAEDALLVFAEARRRGLGVLGLEGFLIDDDYVYPALSRIANFSRDGRTAAPGFVEWSTEQATALLNGPWRSPPLPEDQMNADAHGRHMIAIVLAHE